MFARRRLSISTITFCLGARSFSADIGLLVREIAKGLKRAKKEVNFRRFFNVSMHGIICVWISRQKLRRILIASPWLIQLILMTFNKFPR